MTDILRFCRSYVIIALVNKSNCDLKKKTKQNMKVWFGFIKYSEPLYIIFVYIML